LLRPSGNHKNTTALRRPRRQQGHSRCCVSVLTSRKEGFSSGL
jgi:hypothetical protein